MNLFRVLGLVPALLLLVSTAFAAKPIQTRTIDLIPGPDRSSYESAVNPATNKLYSASGASVTVTDLATRLVLRTVLLSQGFVRALVVNPVTNRIYAVGEGTELSVIDGNSDQVVTTITLPHFSHFGLALDVQLNRLYVSNYFEASVSIVDTTTNQVLGSLAVVPGPWGVAVNPATHALYVASGGTQANVTPVVAGQVSVIDPTANPPTLVASVPAPNARGIAFNSASNKIYVARWGNTTDVAVISAVNYALITTLGIDRALSFAVNPTPGINQVYTSRPAGSSLITIDGVTDEVNTAPGNPSEFKIHSVAANVTTGEIAAIHDYAATIFNSANGKVGSVAFAAEPQGIAVNPVTGKMYVLNAFTNSVLVVNASTGMTLKNIPLSGAPGSVIVNPVTNRIYVTTPMPGNIMSIDGSDDHVIYSRPVLILMERRLNPDGSVTERFETSRPNRMALDSTNNVIYVLQEGFVSKVDGAKEAPLEGFEPNPHWPVATGGIDQVGFDSADIAYNVQTNLLYVAAKTAASSGVPIGRGVASIIVKEPKQGPPIKVIVDPGQNDTLPYLDLELNAATGLLYASADSSAAGVPVVKVIDTNAGNATHNSIVATIPLSTTAGATGPLALNPALNRVYAFDGPPYPNSFGAHLITVDTLSNTRDAAFAESVVQYNELDFDYQTGNVYVTARDLSVQGTNAGGIVQVFYDGPDTVAPTGFVASPLSGESYSALLLTSGVISVSDLRSDIASVKVSLRNEQGQYWNGTQWVAGEEVFFDAVQSTSDWKFSFPTREQGLARGAYILHARVTDSAGNARSVSSNFNIIVPGAFSFAAAALNVDENAGSYTVTVNRAGGSDGVAEVIYNVTDGTARNFESSQGATIYGDYVQPSQLSGNVSQRTLRFENGETTKTFTIPITADNFIEGPQTVNLRLFSPTPGAELGVNYRAVLTINDNEPSPRLEHVTAVDLIPGFDTHAPLSVAFNPSTNRVYVAGNNPLRSSGGFSTIDATTGVVIGGQQISAVGGNSIAFDSLLNRVYVLQEFASSFDFRSSVQIFDGTSGLPLTEREVIEGTRSPSAIAVDSVRHKVYVASAQTGGVSILDGRTGDHIGSVELGALTRATLAVNETSNKIYVSNSSSGRGEVFIIDGSSGVWTVVEGIHYAEAMAVNNTTDTTYVLAMTEAGTSEILAIKGGTNAVTVYPINFTGGAIDVDASPGLLYVADDTNKIIRVLNAATGAEARSPIPVAANQIEAAPGLNKLFLTGGTAQSQNAVGVADLATNSVSAIVTAAAPNAATAFHNSTTDKTYIADTQAPLIYVVDAANSVSSRIVLPAVAQSLASVGTAGRVFFSWLTPQNEGEAFTDQNSNSVYDAGEPFVDANGNEAYDYSGSQQVVIGAIDTSTDTIDPTVAIRLGPPASHGAYGFPMAVDEATKKLYVLVNASTVNAPGTLYSINADPASTTFKAVQGQSLGLGSFLNLAINPESGRLYVTRQAPDEHATVDILVLSTSTLGSITTVPVLKDQIFGTSPFGLAVDSSSGRVYLARTNGAKQVYVIDGAAGSPTENTVVGNIAVQHLYNHYSYGLGGLAVDKASHRVFVSDPAGDTPVVGIIEGGTTFTDTLADAGAYPGGSLAFNEATQLLYSANTTDGTVHVLRNVTGGQGTLPVPTNLTFETAVPFTAGVPWTFSVFEASNAPGLAVRFQVRSSTGSAWSNLPGTAIRSSSEWTLTTTGVPSGSIVVRAVASAPGFANVSSEESAPLQVFPGSGTIAPVLTRVNIPREAGKPWTFFITADKRVAGLLLQYSVDGTTFQDIAGTKVSHTKTKWTLKSSAVPPGAAFFQVVTLTSGGDVIATTNVRSIFKVDAAIAQVTRQAPLKTAELIGRKVFNADAKMQTKKLTLTPGRSAQFAIELQNASPLADAILVQGPTGNVNLLVQYFEEGGTFDSPVIGDEITTSVVDGTYFSNVTPGSRTRIYLRATAISTTAQGVRTDILVTAKSQSDTTVVDTTKVRITVD